MSDSEDELDLGERHFKKLISVHNNAGFKEGITDGRETQFQSGFDWGFTDGLHSGFNIGQLIALRELNPNDNVPEVKLACGNCTNGPYLPLDDISQQNKAFQLDVLQKLQEAINPETKED